MADGNIRVERMEDVAVVRLNRPPANALDIAFATEIEARLGEVERSDDIRAVVLTGEGRCFCAGLDLKLVPAYSPAEQRAMIVSLNRALERLYALELPCVAALNGHAIAGGMALTLACDFRVGVDASAQIGLTAVRTGMAYPLAAIAVIEAELSPAVARRLVLGGNLLDPPAALAAGILDELAPAETLMGCAIAAARLLATSPRDGYARIKRQLRAQTIARIRAVVELENDPLIGGWITAEAPAASAATLTRAHNSPAANA